MVSRISCRKFFAHHLWLSTPSGLKVASSPAQTDDAIGIADQVADAVVCVIMLESACAAASVALPA